VGAITVGGNSLTGNPLFINPAEDDYHISPVSPAIDAGTDAGVMADMDGEPRPLDASFEIGFDKVDQTSGTRTPIPTITLTPAPTPTFSPPVADMHVYLPLIRK
jgi:hypothetical protein